MSDSIQKRCKECQQWLPATQEFFTPGKKMHDGLRNTCKKCRQASRRTTVPLPDGQRRCARCKEVLPATHEFFSYHRRRGKDFLDSYCHSCDHILYLESYTPRPKRIRTKRSHEETLTHRREHERQRRAANPEQFRENKRRYRQTEKGKALERVSSRNGKMGRRGAPGKYTVADVERMYTSQRGRCYYCRLPFKKGKNAYQVDHIVPWTRGGSNDPSNLVLACPACNMSKGDKLLHEWPQGGHLL